MTAPVIGSRPRRGSGLDPHSAAFGAFADTLYTGILIFALSVPLVTWFAAVSAGVQALREARAADTHVTVGMLLRPFLQRVRRHWLSHLVLPTIMTGLLLLDVLILPFLGAGELLSAAVSIGLASAVGAIALRVAGTWREGVPARAAFAVAWRRMSADSGGSLLLIIAVGAAGAIVSIIPLLAIVMAGPLALAAVAVDHRFQEEA